MERAEAVVEPLDHVAGGAERLADALVGHQHDAALDKKLAHPGQGRHRTPHVVNGLEGRRQIEAAGDVRAEAAYRMAKVTRSHQPGRRRVGTGRRDRRLVGVEAVDNGVRVGPSDGDAQPAGPATGVEDPGRRVRLEPRVQFRMAGSHS